MEEERVRLYVGGLAPQVSAGDLQERFAPLGQVQSITLPPAKEGPGHRGFAYVDFVPATHASLRKLFSAYNGCKWRGGLLRIEKAKEHFIDRLRREWPVGAASHTKSDVSVNEVEAVQHSLWARVGQTHMDGGSKGDLEANGLKIFFPRFRKLRTVPLTGLGKHKRSFQRVESSPLHLLSTCACDESLRSGSCDCSKINSQRCSVKVDIYSERDNISRAIDDERERQLDLLNRLFPSDIASTSLNDEDSMRKGNDVKWISEHDVPGGNIEKLFSKPSVVPIAEERSKSAQHSLQKQQEMMENGMEGDPTSQSVVKERAKQLDLIRKLFPADAPPTREPEQGVQPEISKSKGKRKREAVENSSDIMGRKTDTPRSRITERLQKTDVETSTEQQSEDLPKSNMDHKDNSTECKLDTIVNVGDDSVPLAIGDMQERQMQKSLPALLPNDLLEEDSEMILNLGDDSIPLAFGEEQERLVLKSLPAVIAGDFSEKISESIQNVGEKSKIALGDDSIPLPTAEEQKIQVLRNQGMVVQYEETKVLGASIAEIAQDSDDKDDLLGDDPNSLDNEDYSELTSPFQSTKRERTEASLQRSRIKASMGQQPLEPSKWAALAELCQFRETEGLLQSKRIGPEEKRMPASGSRKDEDNPSNAAPHFQVEESKPYSQQQANTDSTRGQELDDLGRSGQKLTRAAWKSLVGETGRVIFSLRELTGSGLPNVPSLMQETEAVEVTSIQVGRTMNTNKPSQNQTKTEQRGSPIEKKSEVIYSSSHDTNAFKLNTSSVVPVVSSGALCPFMKSENAEKEWLATKSDLRSDYRAKHKHAARHKKKLWGKHT